MSGALVVDATALSDLELVGGVLAGETGFFETLMRRYNQRVFRASRAILRDDAEAEDVAQEAWVRAFQHLRQFEGRASFSTWLTRIAVQALAPGEPEVLPRLAALVRHELIRSDRPQFPGEDAFRFR